MDAYVAFLRGINSGQNPVQSMENLRRIFQGLGFRNVRTVIASGNVLFETDPMERGVLEGIVEKALERSGIDTVAIIRTREEIRDLVAMDPFGKMTLTAGKKTYATFLKNPPLPGKDIHKMGTGYAIIATLDTVIFSVVDLSSTRTPVLMKDLEAGFGREITTRSWATILKIASRFGD